VIFVSRLWALVLAELRGQGYWFVWLAVIVLDLYSARQTEYAPWLWSRYSWWIAPFVLWMTMPRSARWPNARLPALLVFAWLGYSLYDFTALALINWFRNDLIVPLTSLRFIPHFMLAAVIITSGLAHATVRTFGPRAATAALIAGLVAGLAFHGHALLDWSRWIERPLSIHIHLFGTVFFALIYAAGTARLNLGSAVPAPDHDLAIRIANPPRKPWFVGFPGAMTCALMLLVLGALVATQFESFGPWFVWTVQVVSAISALALVSWAGKHALRRALHDAQAQRRLTKVGGRTRVVLIWTGLMALWLPIASLTWKERGKELDELVTALGGPLWSTTLSSDGTSLHYKGDIAEGSAAALKSTLERHPGIQTLELESHGGDTYEGVAMADLVREYNLDTLVLDECESACTTVFAGGRDRVLGEKGALGYHDENAYGLPSGRTLTEKVATERTPTIDDDFLTRTFAVPHWDMWYPDRDELVKAGVLTRVETNLPKDDGVDDLTIGSWSLEVPHRNLAFSATVANSTGDMLTKSCMPDIARCHWYVVVDVPCSAPLVPLRVSAGAAQVSLTTRCKIIDDSAFLTFKDFDAFEALVATGERMDMYVPRAGSTDLVLHFDLDGAQAALAKMHETIARRIPRLASVKARPQD
jgi:hypothetical protein